jgi:hypothetical protein
MRRKRRRAKPGDDARYLAFVRKLTCCAPDLPSGWPGSPCAGRMHAHHITGAGAGMKAGDRDTMPLCARHHFALHEFREEFEGWTREQRRDWQLEQIRRTQALWEREKGRAA